MKKVLWLIVALFCFGIGIYTWKVSNTGRNLQRVSSGRPKTTFTPQEVLVEVGGRGISQADLEFEYRLLTNGLGKGDKLTPIPDLGDRVDAELAPLKEKIINSLVERKMLYNYVEQDKGFDLEDSRRFVSCLEEWMSTVKGEGDKLFKSPADQDRLKTRLCEQSILQQYMHEKIYEGIKVDEAEVLEYFKNHPREFHRPAMVVIRQIVAADEKQAKAIRQKVTKQNFAELAAEHSITPEAHEGGILGPFPMGSGMPRFFDVAFTLRPGQISDILKSTYGFHIIMLEKKYEERDLSFQEAIPEIKALVERKAQERAYQKWVDLALHTIDVHTPKRR